MLTLKKTLYVGVWLCIIPFLGVPGVWKERLLVATGLYLIFVGLGAYYTHSHPRREQEAAAPTSGQGVPEGTK